MPRPMTYEAFLDEVTTLITEKYEVADAAAIAMVMQAQEDELSVGMTTPRRSVPWTARTRMPGPCSKNTVRNHDH